MRGASRSPLQSWGLLPLCLLAAGLSPAGPAAAQRLAVERFTQADGLAGDHV